MPAAVIVRRRVAQGGRAFLTAAFVDAAGVPADPIAPLVVITPAGGPARPDAVPARLELGVWRYEVAVADDDPLGTWTASWSGDVAGDPVAAVESFDVVEAGTADAAGPYGATLEAVKALLSRRQWTSDAKPTLADVAGYIASVGQLVTARIGALPGDPATAARLAGLAQRAVVLGAAAHAEAAASPEKARPADVSTYATWLWARFEEAFDEAGAFADELAPGEGPAGAVDVSLVDEPAWAFPDPVGWAERGI